MPPHRRRERGGDLAEALLSPAGPQADAPPPGLSGTDAAPQRRCVATGRSEPQESLIRFVVDPSGTLVPDLDHKLPGRGLYVASDKALSLRDSDKQRIKAYIDQGGLLLAVNEGTTKEFAESVYKLAREIYPSYEFRNLPPGVLLLPAPWMIIFFGTLGLVTAL